MVDAVRVQRLLRHLVDTIGYLEAEAAVDSQTRRQRRWLDSIKYNVVVAIEAAIDIGQHLCATEGWGPPDTNGDVFRLLGSHHVLSADLAASLVQANGFRHVLVHDYVAVRDDLVIANLDRTSDWRAFASAVAEWMTSN